MAKKFGKFLLFTAAVGTAAAAAYYYMQQKDSQLKESSDADDDYDDFHEDLDKSTEFSRNYVPLNTPVQTSAPKEETGTESTPASEEAAPASAEASDFSEPCFLQASETFLHFRLINTSKAQQHGSFPHCGFHHIL